jgi:hypothetical protein
VQHEIGILLSLDQIRRKWLPRHVFLGQNVQNVKGQEHETWEWSQLVILLLLGRGGGAAGGYGPWGLAC